VLELVNGKSTYSKLEEALQSEVGDLEKQPMEEGWYVDVSGDQKTPPPIICAEAKSEEEALRIGTNKS